MELGKILSEVRRINIANGWDDIRKWDEREDGRCIPTALMLLVSEVSEALEAYRKNDWPHFKEELADLEIRILDLAGSLGIDLESEVLRKNELNSKRGYRHGGKAV